MARIRTRLDAIDRNTQLFLEEGLGPKERSKAIAQFAREALAEAQQHNNSVIGRIPDHEQYVDGRPGAPFSAVRPNGHILIEFELLDDVFSYIGELLVKHSPVGSPEDTRPEHPGLYQRSHLFLADMVPVRPGATIPGAQEYVFVNAQPYARKIERGLSPQAPDGVYEVVAHLAQQRFGNVVNVRFSHRSIEDSYLNAWADTTVMQPSARPARRSDRHAWLRRQPAIVITMRRGR